MSDKPSGRSYFTEKLFRDVILRDKDLVTTFQSQKVRPPIMGWLMTFLGALLTFALLALAGFSLYKNKVMVDEASKRGEAVLTMVRADKDRNPLDKNPEQTTDEIDRIDNLRKSLVELDEDDRVRPSILKRWGLYSGTRLYREKLLSIYFNAIEQRYRKPVMRKLEADLSKFGASNPVANTAKPTPEEEDNLGRHYDKLKAYLMLTGQFKEQAEATFLVDTLKDYWKTESKVPETRLQVAEEQLKFYAKQADRLPEFVGDPSAFPRINLDDANTKLLVENVRKKLQAFPARARYLKRVVTDISKKIEPISATEILGGSSQGVIEGNYAVPGAYTIDGYRIHFKEALTKATEELSKDDWVMGERAEKAQAQGDDTQWIQKTYLDKYTDHWRKFVQNITVAPYENNQDKAVAALKAFSDTASPMKILLEEVSKQTNLSAEPEDASWISSLLESFQVKTKY